MLFYFVWYYEVKVSGVSYKIVSTIDYCLVRVVSVFS